MAPEQRRQRVYAVVRAIPPGKVASYADVAALAGLPRGARQVGRTLREASEDARGPLPWHRVLRADGRLAFPADSASALEQAARLREEGVLCQRGRVAMRHYRWQPQLDELLWGPAADSPEQAAP